MTRQPRRPHAGAAPAHAADEGIGRVLAALDAGGLGEDTLVVFTSDNGGERYSDNWPLVGGTMDLTEGGIRVPCIVRWPKVVAPSGVSAQQHMTMDWTATMLAAAGVAPDPAYPLDGVSLLPVLHDAGHNVERTLCWRMKHREQRAIRQGRWKYLKVDQHEYLFDVEADERERANRAQAEPERLAELRAAWEAWNAGMRAIPADAGVHNVYSLADMPQR